MTDWSRLHHAYGTAEDVPGLLDAVGPDALDPLWNELWSRLCHQGTVYSASYAALPALTEMARRWSAADRQMPLCLAGSIVASTDRPYGGDDPQVAYASQISVLARLTEEALQDPGLTGNPASYVNLLGTLLSFQGVEVWGEQLDGLNDEEYEVPCPSCGTENFIVFGECGFFSTTDSMYMKASTSAGQVPLRPHSPAALDGLGRRLHSRALADGQSDIARRLTYVFGDAQCAECDVVFSVAEAVVGQGS
ncbi:hypothetical protein QBA57_11940 [Streptomyces scabiei]|uniref:hypothetical protein n=1 Tax=Streptomyces scabiei TaxID=1930 RepID=UPI001B30472A|nr:MULTISPECIES: hypothetical protein [Streptomyces]MBP5861138.1 hypothetical protein [Streptomyces sp. LBUM 1484]MBP5878438.1 hypothetical protein [Streptomyces sp. LBUM 1477]MBP5886280.1 hypothetical protein [Streptomyces sp. LBUM 1487]MBP5891036.1 hypothetical protein [Streptomyces sp. LBUM 1481]MBP5902260.1 hypothetical protein [Streptomyces sp. LBUM 1488]